jgi:hypothetical protein
VNLLYSVGEISRLQWGSREIMDEQDEITDMPVRRPSKKISITVHPMIDVHAGDEKTIAKLPLRATFQISSSPRNCLLMLISMFDLAEFINVLGSLSCEPTRFALSGEFRTVDFKIKLACAFLFVSRAHNSGC